MSSVAFALIEADLSYRMHPGENRTYLATRSSEGAAKAGDIQNRESQPVERGQIVDDD
jgi:hypothetical protein